MPEMLCILSSIEALEDNEGLLVKDVYKVATISEPRQDARLTKLPQPLKVGTNTIKRALVSVELCFRLGFESRCEQCFTLVTWVHYRL